MSDGKRKFWILVKWFILVYILCGVLLYFLQDFLLFHPLPLPKDHQFNFPQPFIEINIPASGGRNLSVVKFTSDSSRKGIVLYFHGNRQNIERYANYAHLFTKNHYEIWMMDYPGFGKSTGRRSEQNIYDDALMVYSLAVKETAPSNIIIYGKSIGTGAASYLASIKPCRQLILETPYYNIDALAKHYFPIFPATPMTKFSFPINKYLPKVKAQISIFHGTKDEIIPYKQAQKLKAEDTKINLITIKGGKHNNLPDSKIFIQTILNILK